MKTTITPLSLALSLALGCATPALADHGHRGNYGGDHYRSGQARGGYYAPPAYRGHGGHPHGPRWVGPAAVLAIAGIAAGVAAASYYAPPPVHVAPQPVYVAPPPRPVYVIPGQVSYPPPPGSYWGY